MKLYGSFTSPYVRHCRIALIQEDLDCEFVIADAETISSTSPTWKVPFLTDGDLVLGDSCSIIKFIREKSGQTFFPDLVDYNLFCVTNTMLDTAINVFLLEKDGLTEEISPYFGKQKGRIEAILAEIDGRVGSGGYQLSEGIIRIGCFLEWALFRKRIDITPHRNLAALLEYLRSMPEFQATAIPADA